jgi:hypothetical protein
LHALFVRQRFRQCHPQHHDCICIAPIRTEGITLRGGFGFPGEQVHRAVAAVTDDIKIAGYPRLNSSTRRRETHLLQRTAGPHESVVYSNLLRFLPRKMSIVTDTFGAEIKARHTFGTEPRARAAGWN